MMIKDNIAKIQQRISAACARVKSDPAKIRILCVTKGRSVEEILQVIRLGFDHLGENRVQEVVHKYPQLPQAHWEMVGHLQSNKVKEALKIFELIHSVDSLSLAQEVDRQAARINKVQDILLEVKTSPEASKSGFSQEALEDCLGQVAKFRQLNIKGLMTISPAQNTPEEARPYFTRLRRLRDKINPGWLLSMGMSDDFEVAIEEGAAIIRLGRIIFES
jgi:PLP dependent protein